MAKGNLDSTKMAFLEIYVWPIGKFKHLSFMAWLKSNEDTRQGTDIQFVTIVWIKTGPTHKLPKVLRKQ